MIKNLLILALGIFIVGAIWSVVVVSHINKYRANHNNYHHYSNKPKDDKPTPKPTPKPVAKPAPVKSKVVTAAKSTPKVSNYRPTTTTVYYYYYYFEEEESTSNWYSSASASASASSSSSASASASAN